MIRQDDRVYLTITGHDPRVFSGRVDRLLKDGWMLYGPPGVVIVEGGKALFTQTLIKPAAGVAMPERV
jgi:hypothetical protein